MKIILLIMLLALASCSSTENKQAVRSNQFGEVHTNLNKQEQHVEVESTYPKWVTELHNDSVVTCAKVKQGNIPQAQTIVLAKAQANIAFMREVDVTSSVDMYQQVKQHNGKQLANDSTFIQNTRQYTSGTISDYEIKKTELLKVGDREELCILYGSR